MPPVLMVETSNWMDQIHSHASPRLPAMITAAQMRAARALLGIDQKDLARLSGLSLPTIQRMEASQGNVRGVVGSLMKVVGALDEAGIELLGEGVSSSGAGYGVRLKEVRGVTPADDEDRQSKEEM